MDKKLTEKQSKVLAVLEKFIASNRGKSPTFSELRQWLARDGLKLKSNNSLVQYLKVLAEKGFVERFSKARGIRLLTESLENFFDIPLFGKANCGTAASFAENYIEDFITISSKYVKGDKKDYFFIKAEGDSMDRKGIKDGDLILAKRTSGEVRNGDVVVVSINGLATIKKFYRKSGNPVLLPESNNLKHKPIILHPSDRIYVCGKVQKVFDSKIFNM